MIKELDKKDIVQSVQGWEENPIITSVAQIPIGKIIKNDLMFFKKEIEFLLKQAVFVSCTPKCKPILKLLLLDLKLLIPALLIMTILNSKKNYSETLDI